MYIHVSKICTCADSHVKSAKKSTNINAAAHKTYSTSTYFYSVMDLGKTVDPGKLLDNQTTFTSRYFCFLGFCRVFTRAYNVGLALH